MNRWFKVGFFIVWLIIGFLISYFYDKYFGAKIILGGIIVILIAIVYLVKTLLHYYFNFCFALFFLIGCFLTLNLLIFSFFVFP